MHNYAYTEHMRYTHDPKKRAANLKKHGYDFEDAPQVIESGRTVTFEDRRFDYDEQRFITLGVLREEVVVITTAETDEEIRVISMRKAERNEQEIYYSNL
ncbi:BrnT family toxin [Accumulibacter sp.]|uniref:BrnT family toxin n=1 Tax=Accumulibacter sp. TaxID=2053492 RepID=UPI002D1FA449|nr:BrnT family toxin [Accumulibacter sp.]